MIQLHGIQKFSWWLKNLFTMRFSWLFLFFVLPFLWASVTEARVKDTKHNLSVSGTGDIRATEEQQICIFCHTPHNASPVQPLWNHDITAVSNYTNYWRSSLQSYNTPEEAPPIDGFSRLCLSCHDGTVAIGAVVSNLEDIEVFSASGYVDGEGKLLPTAPGYIGTDLSGGHPISIIFNDALANSREQNTTFCFLNYPSGITDTDVRLYPTQGAYGVQCTSCHDPHGGKGGPSAPPFWRKATHDEVCNVCHIEGCLPPGELGEGWPW